LNCEIKVVYYKKYLFHVFIYVDRRHNIGKKWRKVVSYTLWMFEYYIKRTKNELLLDDVDALLLMGLKNTYLSCPEKVKLCK
jgi:hypothetical protein